MTGHLRSPLCNTIQSLPTEHSQRSLLASLDIPLSLPHHLLTRRMVLLREQNILFKQ
jgi:hypothetical protein